MLQFQVKLFSELSTNELYQLLQLRSEVFVVEQNCVYQDLDGKDDKALHVLGFHKNNIVAYSRIFDAGDYFKVASIGRVVVSPKLRGHQLGYDLMKSSIQAVKNQFKTETIKISAQVYLKSFYNNLGFVETSASYLEDGIPHVEMMYN